MVLKSFLKSEYFTSSKVFSKARNLTKFQLSFLWYNKEICANEVTHGGPLDSFERGWSHVKEHAMKDTAPPNFMGGEGYW